MATGAVVPGYRYPQQKKNPYTAAIESTGNDYNEIMNRYRKISDTTDPRYSQLEQLYKNQLGQQPQKYTRGAEMSGAFKNLEELARTGGLTPEGIANIRARGVSPIRSVYANAQQNMSRQRALQGGYSPSYNVASTKMARELSEQLAGATTNVEANIAEQVQRGRLSAAPQYGQLAQRETELMNEYNKKAELQRTQALDSLRSLYGMQDQRQLEATGGMRSLYGTTPATPALYGGQAIQRAELDQRERGMNQNALMAQYQNQLRKRGGFSLG